MLEVFDQWESDVRGYSRAWPTVFTRASNARQWDEAGKSYIDFFAGAGVLNFGHNNPRMKKAIISFMEADGVAHSLDMATTPKRAFIKAFVDTIMKPRNMPHKLQFMGPTGTNAVEAALKIARRATGRSNIIAFGGGFHGMTLGSLACTANSYFRNAAGVSLNNVTRLNFGHPVKGMTELFTDPSSGIEPVAGIIVEPIQAEGGVNVAAKEWLLSLQEFARSIGALLIFDDIQAGCGRTGNFFSFDEMGLDPDIICLAKGIGGFGTPLAMNLNKPEYDKHWSPGEHTGTFRGQGLSFVAGKEAISYFEDEVFLKDVSRKGDIMRDRLVTISEKSLPSADIRGKGMMQAIDTGDGAFAKAVAEECFRNGLLVGPCGSGGRVVKLIPPLTVPDEDLEEGLNILEAAFQTVGEAA